jgi:nitrate/nitrite transporter NarK
VFFLIPFALVRVYQDSGLAAGLRLSILPVALGLLAPVGGALYDRFEPRAPTSCGMLICLAGLSPCSTSPSMARPSGCPW